MRLRKSFWLSPLLVLSCVFILTASIPNVASGTWQTWNPMGDVRSGAAAVLLQDGRVLITGGNNANRPVASADLFGTDGNFSAAAVMQSPRSGHTATVLSDGRVLVAGGATSGGGITNSAEIYDPSADSWTLLSGTMVDARSGHTASLLPDGRVLLAGGQNSGGAINGLEIFDPSSGNFSGVGVMTSARMSHAAASLQDGRVLLLGGSDGTNPLASVDVFDPGAGTVSAGPNLSSPRVSASATTTLDGKVAVIGGNNGASSGPADLATADILVADPSTGQLSSSLSASHLLTPRSGHQSFLLPKNNAILVIGGSSSGTDLNSAELYSPWADTFQATGSMSVPRPGFVGSVISHDGMFLAAGGTNLSSTELYGFATVKTDAADYPPGSTVTITGSGWQPGETVTLTLVESPLIDTHPPLTAVADALGNISNNQFSPDVHDVNVRFYLTAVGSQSEFQAQNTFTDAPGDNTDTTVACSPNSVTVNTATTCTATVKNTQAGAPNGSPQGSVNWQFNGTGNFSSTSCTLVAGGGPATSQCQVTLTPTVAANGNVKGNYNSSDNNKWKNSTSPNFGLTVTAPTDTTPPVITPNVVGTLGNNGWYTSDVAVSWTVTDPESSITSSSGCGTTNITVDTAGTTLTCTATSAGGTSSQSVTIKRDATPPTGVSGAPNRAADHNGWYNHALDVVFTGTDTMSGIDSCTTSTYSGPDGAGRTVNGTCTDKAGNTSAPVASSAFDYDATAPTGVGVAADRSPDSNGYYNHAFTATWTGTDATSGIDSCTSANYTGPDTNSGSLPGSCTDKAGNTSTHAVNFTFKYDDVAPISTIALNPAAPNGNNGWYTTNVHVTVSATDNLSGVAETRCVLDPAGVPASFDDLPAGCAYGSGGADVTTDGMHVIYAASKDVAANKETPVKSASFKIDKTAPTGVSGAPNRAPDHNGWYNHAVDVVFTGTDTVSGIDSCTTSTYSGPDGAGRTVNGTCTDRAGNMSASVASSAFDYDATAPTGVTVSAERSPDAGGYYNHAFTATWTGTDATSGIDSCTSTNYTGPDTNSGSLPGSCTDKAGNTSGAVNFTFKYDDVAPTSTIGLNPAAPNGNNGWYTTNVHVTVSATDNLSGVAETRCVLDPGGIPASFDDLPAGCTYGSGGADVTTDGMHVIYAASKDVAANKETPVKSASFKIDKTPPTIAFVNRTPANGFGWNNTDVTVNWSCSDATSGPVLPSVSQTVSSEGASQSATGTGTDYAGNLASNTQTGINIDKTKPTVTITTPVNGATYTLNQAVVAGYSCADQTALSGIDSCVGPVASGSNINTSSVGNKSFTVTATDRAGNTYSQTVNYNVQYNVCLLYDPTRAVKSGATYPLKLYLCDVNSNDVSSSGIIVHATSIFMASGFTGAPEDAGNANPDSDFRFDSTLGPSGGYIFNLQTTGLMGGTYGFTFTASNDPTTHTVLPGFGVK